jgi:Uma2 family endonuclease
MTLEAFLELPEEKPSLEYENGMVTQKVPPQGRHAGLQASILELVNRATRPRKVALALPELRTTYAGYSRVPDSAVYRWDRIPVGSKGRIADEFFEPPDVAIEIISPGQTLNQLTARCQWYVDNGVRVALIVGPDAESIRVLRPGVPLRDLDRSDVVDLTDAVPALTLSVAEVFDGLVL